MYIGRTINLVFRFRRHTAIPSGMVAAAKWGTLPLRVSRGTKGQRSRAGPFSAHPGQGHGSGGIKPIKDRGRFCSREMALQQNVTHKVRKVTTG